ncbi:MAG: hypothetical protein KJ069_28470 [Anaerolineae bacterium]|nr:hypothetical protein [Anaerolineae bacterium]
MPDVFPFPDAYTVPIMDEMTETRAQALQRFGRARRQATIDLVTARLTGRDTRLLPFDAIRSELRWQNPLYRGVQEISVTAVVGSVGRYREFNRQFLPLSDSLRERWAQVDALAATAGWPPIEVYQMGNVYFVRDGNHRVSVARHLQIPTIEAHVWEYAEEIEIDPDSDLDQIFIQLGKRTFMQKTGLDILIPDHTICFTSPGRYTELLMQIQELRQTLAAIDGEEMPYLEAVAAWYEMDYLPTVQIIHDSNLLADFPGRTEADLFVWLSKYRSGLGDEFAEYDNLADLAQLLAERYREGGLNRLTRQMRRLLGSGELPPLVEIE